MKITRQSNFRVVIEPRLLGNYGWMSITDRTPTEETAKEYLSRCRSIADDVRRHVDDVHSVDVECDTKEVCSHCGREWEEATDDNDLDFPKGTPLCCNAAIEEFRQAQQPARPDAGERSAP